MEIAGKSELYTTIMLQFTDPGVSSIPSIPDDDDDDDYFEADLGSDSDLCKTRVPKSRCKGHITDSPLLGQTSVTATP